MEIGLLEITNPIMFEILDGILHDAGILQEEIQFHPHENILDIPIRVYLQLTSKLVKNYRIFKLKKFPVIKGNILIYNVDRYIFEHKNEHYEYEILDVLYHENRKCIEIRSSLKLKFLIYVADLKIKVVFNDEDVEFQKKISIFS